MARLRQQNPQNYISSSNISSEFENVVRYINAAELGDKTIGELLDQIFDTNGEWDGPIEIRLDSSAGLQYRVGTYTGAEVGWQTITTVESLRGPAGRDVGDIGAPIIHARQDTTATAAQTVVSYAHDADDELIVFVDGVLKVPGGSNDYTSSDSANTVTFTSAFSGGEIVTIYKIRATAITGFTRSDTVTTASQTVFPFVHDTTAVLQVYKNGILQRSGGSNDYVSNAETDTVTFTSAVPSGNTVSIITVENTTTNAVTGLMLEGTYTDTATGLIPYSALGLADGDVPQAKINGLVSHIANAAKITISSSAPVTPATGDLWLDTSLSPNILKFYDGTQFLRTSPESGLPTFTTSDAGKVVSVNGTGTALVYADIDLTSVVPVTQKGAANGVATLDSSGRLPATQLPAAVTTFSIYDAQTGNVANGSFTIQRIFKERARIIGVSVICASGTADVQIQINGVSVGSTYAVSSAGTEVTLSTPQEVDALSTSKRIGYVVTNEVSLVDLEVTLALEILSS